MDHSKCWAFWNLQGLTRTLASVVVRLQIYSSFSSHPKSFHRSLEKRYGEKVVSHCLVKSYIDPRSEITTLLGRFYQFYELSIPVNKSIRHHIQFIVCLWHALILSYFLGILLSFWNQLFIIIRDLFCSMWHINWGWGNSSFNGLFPLLYSQTSPQNQMFLPKFKSNCRSISKSYEIQNRVIALQFWFRSGEVFLLLQCCLSWMFFGHDNKLVALSAPDHQTGGSHQKLIAWTCKGWVWARKRLPLE